MSARDVILAAVRKNRPQPPVSLPDDPGAGRQGVAACLGYREQFTHLPEVTHSHMWANRWFPTSRSNWKRWAGDGSRSRTLSPLKRR